MIDTDSLVHFRPDSSIDRQIFASYEWLDNLLGDQEWDVGRGRFEVMRGLGIFGSLDVLYLRQLKLRWTSDQTMLMTVSHISFPCLKELYLNGNNLTSIEALTQTHLPNLENLNLKQNNISSLHSLRRCNLPQLKQLSLYKNKIRDVASLNELHSPELEKIWYNGKLEDGNIIGSVTWAAKLEATGLKAFIVRHRKRIEEEQAWKGLQGKFGAGLAYKYMMQDDRLLNWL